MIVIHKVPINAQPGRYSPMLPADAHLIHAGWNTLYGHPSVWYTTGAEPVPQKERTLIVAITGSQFAITENCGARHIGSFETPSGLMFHVFEETAK